MEQGDQTSGSLVGWSGYLAWGRVGLIALFLIIVLAPVFFQYQILQLVKQDAGSGERQRYGVGGGGETFILVDSAPPFAVDQ